jgi:hypothetical protein
MICILDVLLEKLETDAQFKIDSFLARPKKKGVKYEDLIWLD